MKAQIIQLEEKLYILFNNGSFKEMLPIEVRSFLETCNDEANYPEITVDLFTPNTFEEVKGEVLVTINDDYSVIFHLPEFLSNILNISVNYITAAEYATKHGKGIQIIHRLCRENRIAGQMKKGKQYLIPEDAPYPKDARLGRVKI